MVGRVFPPSAELLGQTDEDALGAADVAEPVHPPEVLRGMLDNLARLRDQGLDVIEDGSATAR
jgi:hypothetical protein